MANKKKPESTFKDRISELDLDIPKKPKEKK